MIVEEGPPRQIFEEPTQERTRQFLQRALGEGPRARPAPPAENLRFNQLRFAL